MRISDWSSDVCSSDLRPHRGDRVVRLGAIRAAALRHIGPATTALAAERRYRALNQLDRTRLAHNIVGDTDRDRGATVIDRNEHRDQIGRASCREKWCQYV